MSESVKIVEQCLEQVPAAGPDDDRGSQDRLAGRPEVGPDGLGNSLEHIEKIMSGSMEALIHHFKLVTEGIRVPAGQVYVAVESPRGEVGVHMVSDCGTPPVSRCITGTRRSPTFRPSPRCAKAAWSPT